MRSFFVILGALVLLSAVAAAATWATTPADVAPPGEAAQSAAPSESAETARVGAGTQILRATESGVEAEVIDDPRAGATSRWRPSRRPRTSGSGPATSPRRWYAVGRRGGRVGDAAEDAVATVPDRLRGAGHVTAGELDLSLVKYVDGTEAWTQIYDGPAHGSDEALAVAARGTAIYTAGQRETKCAATSTFCSSAGTAAATASGRGPTTPAAASSTAPRTSPSTATAT